MQPSQLTQQIEVTKIDASPQLTGKNSMISTEKILMPK